MFELCCQRSSLKGPLVTMFAASVHLSPNCSTAFLLTARNEVCADLLEEPRLRVRQLDLEGLVVERLDAHLVRQRVAVVLLGVAALYSCAPTMP